MKQKILGKIIYLNNLTSDQKKTHFFINFCELIFKRIKFASIIAYNKNKSKTGSKMYKYQLGIKFFLIIYEKIIEIYNEYGKSLTEFDLDQESEQYNFDLW